jgi:hypothetical protein
MPREPRSPEEVTTAMTTTARTIRFALRNDHLGGPGDTENLEELEVDDLEDDEDDWEDDEEWEDDEDEDEEVEWEEEDFEEESAEEH